MTTTVSGASEGVRVTIGLSTYNRAATLLPEALGSAVAQTYSNLEILISDNASTDETEAVVRRFDDPRIRYVKQPRNLGANGNFNYCLEHASGEFFLLLHDDDLLDPDMIEACVRALEGDPNVGMVRTGTRVIDGEGRVLGAKTNRVGGAEPAEFLLGYFRGRTSIYFASTLFHTDRLRAAGGLESTHNLLEDGVATTKLLREPRVDIAAAKASFRRHGDNRGTAQKIDLWCEDSRDLLDMMIEVAGEHGPKVRREGLRFFSRQNYVRLHRAGVHDRAAFAKVHEAFGRTLSPLEFALTRGWVARILRGLQRRLPGWNGPLT